MLYLVILVECIKKTDYCRKIKIKGKEQECQGKFNLNCGGIVCAKDYYSCASLSLLSRIKENQATEKDFYYFFKNNFNAYLNLIKNCSTQPPKYKWSPTHVCLNTIVGINSNNKTKCFGKYFISCNNQYCAFNKKACDGLTNNTTNYASINKCKQKDTSKLFIIRF